MERLTLKVTELKQFLYTFIQAFPANVVNHLQIQVWKRAK